MTIDQNFDSDTCTYIQRTVNASDTIQFLPCYTNPSYVKAILFLISAIANAGFKPLGQVREQLRIV